MIKDSVADLWDCCADCIGHICMLWPNDCRGSCQRVPAQSGSPTHHNDGHIICRVLQLQKAQTDSSIGERPQAINQLTHGLQALIYRQHWTVDSEAHASYAVKDESICSHGLCSCRNRLDSTSCGFHAVH